MWSVTRKRKYCYAYLKDTDGRIVIRRRIPRWLYGLALIQGIDKTLNLFLGSNGRKYGLIRYFEHWYL